MKLTTVLAAAAVALAGSAVVIQARAAPPPAPAPQAAPLEDLPEGQGSEEVETFCTTCHQVKVILARPRTRSDWQQIVDRMARQGLHADDDTRREIVDYLATRLGAPG